MKPLSLSSNQIYRGIILINLHSSCLVDFQTGETYSVPWSRLKTSDLLGGNDSENTV